MNTIELLTPAELCERLKISRRTYTRLLAKGLPCRMVMSDRRFVFSEVIAWLPVGTERTPSAMPSGSVNLTSFLKRRAASWGR